MNNLVSVIIMIYNNKSYLYEALDSVFIQDYPNIEIIISDDCSNDFNEDDIEEVKKYIENNKKNNIKKYIVSKNNNNLGVVKNYNKCLVLSSGQYIMYLSCDDSFYDKDVVHDVVDFFKNSNYMIATSYLNPFDTNGLSNDYSIKYFIDNNIEFMKGNPKDLFLRLSRGNFIAGANTYFTRELLEKYGLYDEDYILLEDWPRYLNLSIRGCPIGLINRCTINYRMGGITTNNTSTVSTDDQKVNIRDKISRDYSTACSKEIQPYLPLLNSSYDNFDKIVLDETKKNDYLKSKHYDLICYISHGDMSNFSEEVKVTKKIYPLFKIIKEHISLSSFKNIKYIRIDPIDCRCIIKINSILAIKDNISTSINAFYTNTYTVYENIWFFGNDDPQIVLVLESTDIDTIYIEYEFISFNNIAIF